MDPITTSIVASVTAGFAGGLTKAGEKAITDSYDALVSLLRMKLGAKSEVVKAVKQLEKAPESEGRKQVLHEEVINAKIDQDPAILKAAQSLLSLIETRTGAGQFSQQATGSYIAQAGPGASATVNVNPKR